MAHGPAGSSAAGRLGPLAGGEGRDLAFPASASLAPPRPAAPGTSQPSPRFAPGGSDPPAVSITMGVPVLSVMSNVTFQVWGGLWYRVTIRGSFSSHSHEENIRCQGEKCPLDVFSGPLPFLISRD